LAQGALAVLALLEIPSLISCALGPSGGAGKQRAALDSGRSHDTARKCEPVSGPVTTIPANIRSTPDLAVTPRVNGIGGGNSTVGTVATTGVYTTPEILPMAPTVT